MPSDTGRKKPEEVPLASKPSTESDVAFFILLTCLLRHCCCPVLVGAAGSVCGREGAWLLATCGATRAWGRDMIDAVWWDDKGLLFISYYY
jgi:hypothetical protein